MSAPKSPADQHPLLTYANPVGLMSGENPLVAGASGGHQALKHDLQTMGVPFEETDGKYGIPERSFVIHGLPKENLMALGKKYGQESVIHSEGGKRELIFVNGPSTGMAHPGLPTHDYWPENVEPPEDYYTRLPGKGHVRLHFDMDQKVPVEANARAPAPAPAHAPGPFYGKHEIGHALYQTLKKTLALAEAKPNRHPHAYDWHDGHSDHHFPGHGPGGVLISRKLRKDEPSKHPHVDGALPQHLQGGDEGKRVANDQAAGVGVKSYHQFALPFGHIDQAAKAAGGSNLFHYDYNGKNEAVNKLVADHGYQHYYAGGKFGKPDLAKRNYNSKHLMIYDPTQEESSFGDPLYTDSWRKTHELAHALTYPELNQTYGEGRRIGKLGHHRTEREALRAVHWEWLAAHKQRELNKSLGIHVPDEVFNKELNTVMHDAAHRAVTGKFTEPSGEGFTPHAHPVPLETSLGMVRGAARNLGLTGEHDLLRKSENGSNDVADEKNLSMPETLHSLHKGLKDLVSDFEKKCLDIRKAETDLKGMKKLYEQHKTAGHHAAAAGAALQLAHHYEADTSHRGGGAAASKMWWDRHHEHHSKAHNNKPVALKKAAVTDGGMGSMAKPPAPGLGEMAMAEGCKVCGEKGCDCSKAEAYAKSEKKMACSGDPLCKCASCSKMEKYAKGELKFKKGSGEMSGSDMGMMEKGDMPASSSPSYPGKKIGVLDDDKKPRDLDGEEGSGGEIVKKAQWMPAIHHAAPAGIGDKKAAAPKPGGGSKMLSPDAPKQAINSSGKTINNPFKKDELEKTGSRPGSPTPPHSGSMPAPMPPKPVVKPGLLGKAGPGMAAPAAPGAAPAAPKLPGAGGGMKPPKLPGMGGAALGGMPKPAAPKTPPMGAGSPQMGKAELAKAGPPPVPAAAQKPGVISSAPSPLQQPGGAVGMSFKGTMGLPHGGAPVGGGLPKPAQGVRTMAERVAARVPQGHVGNALQAPAGAMGKTPLSPAAPAPAPSLPGAHLFGKAELKKEHIGFNKLAGELGHEKGVKDPKAVAAAIGQKKYGKEGMAHKAAAAKKSEGKPSACPKCGDNHKGVDHATAVLMEPEPKVLHPSDKKKGKK